jgi:membrane protein YqaA with SNARE-associated domain
MAIFSKLYSKILVWSNHQHAVYYLALVAFSEALIFPIPPDVMLVSMGLVKPERAWFYAGVTGFFSIMGGMLGYLIGAFCFDLVFPYIQSWGYESTYNTVHDWFATWGAWTIIGASFMPIPFKILSISAGAVKMPFYSFVLAAILGRGTRFLLVSGAMFLYGEKVSVILHRYIDKIGLAILGIPAVGYLIYALFS